MEKIYFESLKKIKEDDVKVLLKKSYRGVWETAIKKYTDSAHFIYELLQNADDAKASWVIFDLRKDGLWFTHNGTVRFTISNPENEEDDSEKGSLGHINSITSIGNSTKIDEQKIGKFGIGFKAVFAYSNTPHIYDDNFNFKLENYIVPVEIDPNGTNRGKGETAFFFPFNHKTKNPTDAYNDIETKLKSLFQPILFLTNLKKIEWSSLNNKGSYSKKEIERRNEGRIDAVLYDLQSSIGGEATNELLWLFSTGINYEYRPTPHKISVGFFVLDNREIETGYSYEAFCFFPTKEDTKFGFLIQAPFLLTDSREGIQSGDLWNKSLINQTAKLAANSLEILKEIGIENHTNFFDDSILEIIPVSIALSNNSLSNAKVSFEPFYHEIRNAFLSKEILPGRNGKYFSSEKAYWASDTELSELFSDEQLSDLFNNDNAGWVFVSAGKKQLNQSNKALETYINSITAESVDAKKLLRRFTPEFVEKQSDEWLMKFYKYLGDHKYLWNDKDRLAVKQPIILNQNRKAVFPFNQDLTAHQIFLPLDRESIYDTIYKPFIEDADSYEFFKAIGISKPDTKAEVYNDIIPSYKKSFDYEDTNKIYQHFNTLLKYYGSCSSSEQEELIKNLKKINFIASEFASDNELTKFTDSENLYFFDEKLKIYFENTKDIYFLDEDFYAEYLQSDKKDLTIQFFNDLGVTSIPKLSDFILPHTSVNKEIFGLDDILISHKYSSNTILKDKFLDGLNEVLEDISAEKSILLWEYLLSHSQGQTPNLFAQKLQGNFHYYPRGYSFAENKKFESSVSSALKQEAWLLDKENNFRKPGELSLEDLNERYNLEDHYVNVLLEFLEVNNPDADLNLNDEQLQAYQIGKKLLAENITPDELNDILSELTKRRKIPEPAPTLFPLSEVPIFDADISDTFSKINKGIKKNFKEKLDKTLDKSSQENTLFPSQIEEKEKSKEEVIDEQDDFIKPAVNVDKQIEKLTLQAEAKVEELTRIKKLNEIANEAEDYSFAWFKALLELEYLNSSESNTQGKEISIQFSKVELEPGTDRVLVLKSPNRYIPQSIEDIGDIQLRIYEGEEIKSVSVEVVNVKEYTLRAKLKKSADISEIDFAQVSRVVIDIKNPVFILEELRKSFYSLGFDDDKNLMLDLTEQIKFIFGPPGTGKTTHLAEKEIIPLMKKKEDLKVLVLTPTNKACDVLTKRIIEKMDGDESYVHWLLRFGSTADPALENSSVVVEKSFDIRTCPRNTTITTIARFAYDYFHPDPHSDRLHLKYLAWDYIIIDEASMINLASIVYALYQMPSAKFIIAGDPFQIQPITQVEQWKNENIYKMVNLESFTDPDTRPHEFEIINLDTQYRSIPSIGRVFSEFTYGGILKHHRPRESKKELIYDGVQLKDITLIKFPVSPFESIYCPNTLNKSNYQTYSALFTVEFVLHLAQEIIDKNDKNFKIGIICPYRPQALIIEKLITQKFITHEKVSITVGTIHGFQGDECDIIISVFNPPQNISKGPNMFLNKQNILNVAISRASDYLIILMPDDDTEKIENLWKIKKIEELANSGKQETVITHHSKNIEERLFGDKDYIYENSFATTHQTVNVYSKPIKKYEIRCEEFAVDVQIKE